ncbi:mechanosensitive ion channel family protein [Rickettsiella endosymbiont of Dermanyssus gallinae]|uniref:mechanosensitive ion channel family protein n=1 Tax=Rickettsiella endosymbiont of Dermanyssus gallinae TaxID=2856608 RepID=UPI001C52A200|nr:mechanosensitive ion channel family protein [Rickettsiella endosymbiont of Dermanyssus gallinae]
MNTLHSVYKMLLQGCVIRACIALIITGLLCFGLRLLYKKMLQRFDQGAHFVSCASVKALYNPLIIFVAVIGATYSFEWLCWHWELEAQQFQFFRRLVFIALFAWFLWRFVTFYSTTFLKRKNKTADTTLVHALSQIAKIAIVIVSALSLSQLFGLSIAGVLAFGGMGGILIGFASKDLLANVFGSLMLFLDRPFVIGDQIVLPALKVEGQVQAIGWRVCRLLTPDCRPVYIPNALFSNLVVENRSRMKHRRFSCAISLRYQDIAKVPAILQAMQSVLKESTAIDKDRAITVNLSELAHSSLNISINAFTKLVNSADFLTLQQTLYLQLLDCVHSHGAKWAFPTNICLSAQESELSAPK